MGELRQHHPSLRISKVKALKKGDLLVVGYLVTLTKNFKLGDRLWAS